MNDAHNLARFVDAQDRVWPQVLAELRAGRKTSHWMWFVFPQIAGLGNSPMSQHYAISGLEEARAYLGHPVLGPRLRACAAASAAIEPGQIERAFGAIDTIKLCSSMTLFELADPSDPVFKDVIERHFAGARDAATLARLP